jgi:chloramphenicol-sensitive protein RarD
MNVPAFISAAREFDAGLWAALGSFFIWGALPLYWYLSKDVSPYRILGQRIVWSCIFLFPLIILSHRMKEVVKAAHIAPQPSEK